jgi:hypothetical protein
VIGNLRLRALLTGGALAANPHNNPRERILSEIKRRTRVVGTFPDGQSCLDLAATRLRRTPAPLGRPNDILTSRRR